MTKILGIDTGTNSLGWAIVEKNGDSYTLIDKGVNIFPEGVNKNYNGESSKATDKTEGKSTRTQYWRRKVRKIRVLTILVNNHLCPPLDKEILRAWRLKNVYPNDEAFMEWQLTEDKKNVNPYRFRYICLTHKLDMSDLTQRYILGRALYHLNQRRGFLSSRKEATEASDGEVAKGINDLSKEIANAGCTYLGEYFYHLYQEGKKIRNHYTDREEHYIKEFHAICAKQELDEELVKNLECAIFSERDGKSQKWQVGKCKHEKRKPCCPSSHPLFEDFNMYSFLNGIRIQTPHDKELRPLTEEEKNTIIPLFKRKSKRTFVFEDIANKLAGENNYCYYKDDEKKPYIFNYHKEQQVAGCIVNAQLEGIFGKKWLDAVCKVYTLAAGKSDYQIMNDIWHALFFGKSKNDKEKLKEFAKNRLQLDEKKAKKFSEIYIPSGYASLSLKAIRKILPYMRDYGLIESHAVFLANLDEVLPHYIWGLKEAREVAIEKIINLLKSYDKKIDSRNQKQRVNEFLIEMYNVSETDVKKLYHPSSPDFYPPVHPNDDGIYQLESPKINNVRNPVVTRALFRLCKVVNLLLKEGKIDADTIVHIELARELNNANRRKAIQKWQFERNEAKKTYVKKIKQLGIANPSDTDILKYELWEEQGHKCLYTNTEIKPEDFLFANPKYDIEHTIPLSVGGDSTKMNLTLCDSEFNRNEKREKLPAELEEEKYKEILERIKGWKKKYEDLDKQIRKIKTIGIASKEKKDENIIKRHKLSFERDYWKGKYQRFEMKTVPEDFSRRQGTDAGLISKYARLYLKSVFKHVESVKGIVTSDFRTMWGIQEEYTQKDRGNHVHHCIDAIIIACIGNAERDKLARFYRNYDNYRWYGGVKPQFEKPWPTFDSDMKQIQDELLVVHSTKDNVPKHTKRYVKVAKKGRVLAQGDTARGSLHEKTYYGAIKKDGKIMYVGRKVLCKIKEKDVEGVVNNIVDGEVRDKVDNAIAKHGSLKKALEETIWMNEEKRIPIKKVRCLVKQKTPLEVKPHRDVSVHEHKRNYLAWNDSNYMVAIYIGKDNEGEEKREFKSVNMLDAVKYYKRSNVRNSANVPIVPLYSMRYGFPLAYKLYIGQMVILYDKYPEEVWEGGMKYIRSRLYKITGMSLKDGRMTILHHQEARPSKELPPLVEYQYDGNLMPKQRINFNKFQALVQGLDFEINDLGDIKRKKHL